MQGLEEKRRIVQSSAISKLFIAIDEVDGSRVSGKISSAFDNCAMSFDNLWEMVTWADKLFDQHDFPQVSHSYRSFFAEEELAAAVSQRPFCDLNVNMQTGKLATFIVHVQFRQNCTWQGAVQWIERKSAQRFRSVWELLRMMDEALRRP